MGIRGRGQLGYDEDNQGVQEQDIVFWYVAHLPHMAALGPTKWGSPWPHLENSAIAEGPESVSAETRAGLNAVVFSIATPLLGTLYCARIAWTTPISGEYNWHTPPEHNGVSTNRLQDYQLASPCFLCRNSSHRKDTMSHRNFFSIEVRPPQTIRSGTRPPYSDPPSTSAAFPGDVRAFRIYDREIAP